MKLAQDADDDEQAAREAAHLAIRRDALRPKPLLQGGGLYPWERLVERYHDLRKNLSPRLARH